MIFAGLRPETWACKDRRGTTFLPSVVPHFSSLVTMGGLRVCFAGRLFCPKNENSPQAQTNGLFQLIDEKP